MPLITLESVAYVRGFTSRTAIKYRRVFMSDITTAAVAALNKRLGGEGFDGSARFDIQGEGSIVIDSNGARASDEEAEVTLSADADTFQQILEGELNPTAAFMSGKLAVDGDMGQALKLGAVLS
jgi:putative sterol carrier protein